MALARTVVVCPPTWIASNPETAATNAYQQPGTEADRALAQEQFAGFVSMLRGAGVEVLELPPVDDCPDAVFPNNWFSTHADGSVLLYPMLAESRRRERQPEALRSLLREFEIGSEVSFTQSEEVGWFLEGTGSMVFDPTGPAVYAAISPRTHEEVLDFVCAVLHVEPFLIYTCDAGMEIYHTNVVMAVGSDFAVVCQDAVSNRTALAEKLRSTGKEIIDITREQMRAFCGNVLELEAGVVMSSRAYDAFTPEQRAVLAESRSILHSDISAIEKLGGGSTRCMLAEIFLPRKKTE
jgi:hypothetical protein